MTWAAGSGSTHRALLYRDEPEFRATVGAFIREGLARGDQILAAVPAGALAWIRAELGSDTRRVELADVAGFYRRQGQATRAMLDWLRRHASNGQRARVVSEQELAGRTPAEIADYLRMEAAANVVYQPFPVSVLCPYHAPALPDQLRPGVERTHPELLLDARVVPSPGFADPRTVIRDYSAVVQPPPSAASVGFGRGDDLAGVRRFLRAELSQAGLQGDPAQLLLTAAGEAVTNALLHGGAPRRLWVYREGPALVCHVKDGGPGFADPLAAYLAPDRGATHGHGLWLGRQACDCVEVAADGTGTHVRLLTRLPHSGGPEPVP
ncbi:MAG: anti-sigma factor RsbA family regulatory protein [Streptosporangiaceae bacterium]